MTLSVNQVAPIGVYTVTVRLFDDNEADFVSKDYRFIIIIHEGGHNDELEQFSTAAARDNSLLIIDGIDNLGALTILFTQEMTIPRDLSSIDDSVLDIEIYTVDIESTFRREFTWYVRDYKSTNCTIQIVWDSPPWISSTTVRDKLLFGVLRQEKFVDPARRLKTFDDDTVYQTAEGSWEIEIPPQAYQNDATQHLQTASESAGVVLKIWVVSQLVL